VVALELHWTEMGLCGHGGLTVTENLGLGTLSPELILSLFLTSNINLFKRLLVAAHLL
jgi:hypothetical protein